MVEIENRTKRPLPTNVLLAMFAGYHKVVVKSAFTSGRSGSLVFLVRPIRQDGVPELPSVVKIDRRERIQQEWDAYNKCIRNRLSGVAEISGEPGYPEDSPLGGLRYPLVGSGTFDFVSLYTYYHQAETADICYVLEDQLFKRLDALWRHRTGQSEVQLRTYYDSFLPPNLDIIWFSSPPDSVQQLNPETAHLQTFQVGDVVKFANFRVVRTFPETASLVLDVPADVAAAFRFRITKVPQVAMYKVGQVITRPLTGIVRQTRAGQLKKAASKAFGSMIDETAETLTLSNGASLPNPLFALPQLLHRSLPDAQLACIHADLNLQNILIEPQNRNAYLIDFVNARQDHILRDLLHLEMAIVTRLLPEALKATNQTAEIILPFYERLHCDHFYPNRIAPPAGLEKPFAVLRTIRRAAEHYLSERGNWAEYYYGLVFYLMGALRYQDLDQVPEAKRIAFLGTAVTLKLLETPSPCAEMQVNEKPVEPVPPQQEKGSSKHTRPRTETNFLGPVSGPVHTGSGDINISGSTGLQKREASIGSASRRDSFASMVVGLERLLGHLGEHHPRFQEALVYEQRLTENIDRARRFGDPSQRQADRAEIIEQLNDLALGTVGISFNKLCRETAE